MFVALLGNIATKSKKALNISRTRTQHILLNILFSKLIYAEVSKTTGATKRVFHQTMNAQNSVLTKEIHDQGKIINFG